MEAEILSILPNLGVGVASVTVLFLVFRLMIQELGKRDEAFRSYANEHNHETTRVIIEASNNINANTEQSRATADILKEVRNLLIKHK